MDCQLQFGVLSPGVKANRRWHLELGSPFETVQDVNKSTIIELFSLADQKFG